MIKILISIFILLHGLVHLLYMGQSNRYFELQPGMLWPDRSWALSNFLMNENIRTLASVSMILAALTFGIGSVGLLLLQGWGRVLVIFGAAISTAAFFLFRNGRFQNLADQGWVGILINLGILTALIIFQWPKV